MEINSETNVYRVRLYKDNSIEISESDGDVYCVSDTIKRKAQVFSDFNGDVGLTAIGDTEEEALTAIRTELERNVSNAQNAVKQWNTSIDVINSKLKEVNRKMVAEGLMVGDIINYRKNPIRVEEILKTGIIGDKNSKVIPYSKLSPIPMTDDILKVNGFVETSMREGQLYPYSVWRHPQFDYDFVIVKDADGYYSAYNMAEDSWHGSEICAVPDVHSFQHLLKIKEWLRRKNPFSKTIMF